MIALTNEERETLSLVELRKGRRFLELALQMPAQMIADAIHGKPCAEAPRIKRWLGERAQRSRVYDCHLSSKHELTQVGDKYSCKYCDGAGT